MVAFSSNITRFSSSLSNVCQLDRFIYDDNGRTYVHTRTQFDIIDHVVIFFCSSNLLLRDRPENSQMPKVQICLLTSSCMTAVDSTISFAEKAFTTEKLDRFMRFSRMQHTHSKLSKKNPPLNLDPLNCFPSSPDNFPRISSQIGF